MGAILLLVFSLFGCFGGIAQGQGYMASGDKVGYLVWWDKGSGADRDFSCRSPHKLYDYFIVGHNGQNNHHEYMDTSSFILKNYMDSSALDAPIRFDFIWDDKGSGADLDGTVVRPICRAGYVSLGDVMFQGYGNAPAHLYNDVRCVHERYTSPCEFGREIWADHESGADRDVKMLAVKCNQPTAMTSDFFYASDSHSSDPSTTPYGVHRLYQQ